MSLQLLLNAFACGFITFGIMDSLYRGSAIGVAVQMIFLFVNALYIVARVWGYW